VKRFLKTLAFVMVSLFVLVSGVDAALDHISHSVTQSSFTVYDEQGSVLFAYEGDLSDCKVCLKPSSVTTPTFLHRT
jgi:hypothetical protein